MIDTSILLLFIIEKKCFESNGTEKDFKKQNLPTPSLYVLSVLVIYFY